MKTMFAMLEKNQIEKKQGIMQPKKKEDQQAMSDMVMPDGRGMSGSM
jgi:hypothetical protein